MRLPSLRRTLRAQLRDIRVLIQESRGSLLLFLLVLLGGALIFHFFYTFPDTNTHPSFSKALHATFALIFFETLLPLIIANARRSENIRKAGVERADAIIPCTNDELTNLDIALDAREINPEIKVVMRMFDNDLAQRVERGFGIHTAFSTSALAAPIFAAAAMRLNVRHSFYVGDELLNLSEVEIGPGSHLIGWPIEQLVNELDISVVCHHTPAGADLHPDPDKSLQVGDRILVLASLPALRQLHQMSRGRR